jgi:hypothetical protein
MISAALNYYLTIGLINQYGSFFNHKNFGSITAVCGFLVALLVSKIWNQSRPIDELEVHLIQDNTERIVDDSTEYLNVLDYGGIFGSICIPFHLGFCSSYPLIPVSVVFCYQMIFGINFTDSWQMFYSNSSNHSSIVPFLYSLLAPLGYISGILFKQYRNIKLNVVADNSALLYPIESYLRCLCSGILLHDCVVRMLATSFLPCQSTEYKLILNTIWLWIGSIVFSALQIRTG